MSNTHPAAAEIEAAETTFQARVKPWLEACFGQQIAIDKVERNHRFIEEALELVQAAGATASECHQLVDYVFGRPVGEIQQEAGGVMNTLAALCLAHGLDMHEAAEVELARVWTMVEKIRAKQAAKPKHSPLPEAVVRATGAAERMREACAALIDAEADGIRKRLTAFENMGNDDSARDLSGELVRARNRAAAIRALPLTRPEGE